MSNEDLDDCDGILETSPEPLAAIERAIKNETPNEEYDRLLKAFNNNVIQVDAYGTKLTVLGTPIGIEGLSFQNGPIMYDIHAVGERCLSRADNALMRPGEAVHVVIERYWYFGKEPNPGAVVDKFTFTWRKSGATPLTYKTNSREYTFNQALENLLDMRDIAQRKYDE